jgi:hypothetical protein
MTSSTPTKAIPIPAVLVYGKPTAPDLPQASWFRAEDRPSVAAAAQSLKFSVLDIRTEAERALTVGVHEGVLKGNGRMIVGSVAPEVYNRIEEYAAKASPALAAAGVSEKADGKNPATEHTMNLEAAGAATSATQPKVGGSASTATKTIVAASPAAPEPGKPERPAAAAPPWETLRVGSRVLAAYWSEAREFEGFWLATVKRVEGGEFTLEWLESPEYPPFKAPAKDIAVPHPEFRHLRK